VSSSQRAPRRRLRAALVVAVLLLVAGGLVAVGHPNIAASLLLASLWLFLAFRRRPPKPLLRLPRRPREADEVEDLS